MNANEYQGIALQTLNKSLDARDKLINCALGLTGESGEVADLIKKYTFHAHPVRHEDVVKELGDVLWYVAIMADTLGYSLGEVMKLNIDKLRKRYPQGFSSEASINRVD